MGDLFIVIGSMGALALTFAAIETVWRVLRTAALMLRTKPVPVFALRVSISSRKEMG